MRRSADPQPAGRTEIRLLGFQDSKVAQGRSHENDDRVIAAEYGDMADTAQIGEVGKGGSDDTGVQRNFFTRKSAFFGYATGDHSPIDMRDRVKFVDKR